jgi:predicted outer membrane protein
LRYAVRSVIRVFASGVGVLAAVGVACSGPKPERRPQAATATTAKSRATPTQARDTLESGGEVVGDSASAAATVHWISDANALALLGLMNARQLSAADLELSSWHSDTVRAFAATMARTHADLQHSIDSLVDQIHVAPIAPALAEPLGAQMQSQIDSLRGLGVGLDRAYVREQVASHELMSENVRELAGVVERPEIGALLAGVAARVDSALARARFIDAMLTTADSAAAADSASRAEARAASRRRRGG